MAGQRLHERETLTPKDRRTLRAWLKKHHRTSPGAWVALSRRKDSPGLKYPEVVEELLCFGWIDGLARPFDEGRSLILCTPRKPNGTWARSNKERVERLIAEGRMQPAGLEAIRVAKENGAWTKLDAVEAMTVPPDLKKALAALPDARRHFDAFPPSAKKQILFWIQEAKRPETRARRIAQTAELAQRNVRAHQ